MQRKEIMETTNDLVFTTDEVAEKLKTHRNMVDRLRRNGLINGIKLGKGFIFSGQELNRFLTSYAGMDLSNDSAMQEARREVERKNY